MAHKAIPAEALVELRQRLAALPPRSAARRQLVHDTASLYGVSATTLYRALRDRARPRAVRRSDRGAARILPADQMQRYCEIIAAIKLRTSNKQGRHLSTAEAIRLIETCGIDTPDGHIHAPPGVLTRPTVNRYLKQWGYDRTTLLRPPPAVRFQAEYSNDCWHFDLSPSDLKQVKAPAWMQEGRGHPLLMLYSIVDDRSGVAYQEYHGVYGEDVEAALRFLFAAMAPKPQPDFPFQGRPRMLYMDNGPIARRGVFQQVLRYLDIELRTHLPRSQAPRHATARAKGKVERPFRTVKEMHETLYHFHEPETEQEANAWLHHFLFRYNAMPHRTEAHSRLDDWLEHFPPEGLRAMCAWERFCTFAREPERRKVANDARIAVDGVLYQIDPNLVGETVILWWGLFDQELYVEHGAQRYGPYHPVGGPIPLHRYRRFKKTATEQRAERIEALAAQLVVPRTALTGLPEERRPPGLPSPPLQPFVDPDPFQEIAYPTPVAAKLAIADYLAMPLAKLAAEHRTAIEDLLRQTLRKQDILMYIRTTLQPRLRR